MCVRRYRKNCDGLGGWRYSCRTVHHALLRLKRSVGHCELFPCRLLDIATSQGQRQQNRGHGLPGAGAAVSQSHWVLALSSQKT